MIVQCATCEHDDDGRCPNDSSDSGVSCDQYNKWEESTVTKAIREEERARIIELIETKRDETPIKWIWLLFPWGEENASCRSRIATCDELIAELRGAQ